jgi:deferrochelatase/peroxidase EfeB
MFIRWRKTASVRRCFNINQQKQGMWEDQEVNGRTNFELPNSERARQHRIPVKKADDDDDL